MAKHPNGKFLRKVILHNGFNVLVHVVKGSQEKYIPNEKFPDNHGKFCLSMPMTPKNFDDEFIEAINDISDRDMMMFLCPNDIVFEYAYSRIKEMDEGVL